MHEEAVRPLAGETDKLLRRFVGRRSAADLEIHGSPLRGGRGEWRPISQGKRLALTDALLDMLVDWRHAPSDSKVLPFAVVIDRAFSQATIEVAYGALLQKLDEALREKRRSGDGHNGLMVADRGKYERAISAWVEVARAYRRRPQQDRRRLYALVETPFFADSRSSRLMQLADMVSFSFFRAYNFDGWTWAQRLMPAIEGRGALLHLTEGASDCACLSCAA